MEDFNVSHKKVKEKSVYLLHLDNARIVLITAAVIGIIIASFLLGMNFVNHKDNSDTLFTQNDIFDNQKELDLLKSNIPAPPDDKLSKPIEEKIGILGKEESGIYPDQKNITTENLNNEKVDLLTNEDIENILPSPKEKKKISSMKKSFNKGKSSKQVAKESKKLKKKRTTRKRKNKVIEVAARKIERSRMTNHSQYSIQVASFDKRFKALQEVRHLKDMSYDAHVDRTVVKGKRYYRVKIGPISSKRKAINLLNNIQDTVKYGDSFMIRE